MPDYQIKARDAAPVGIERALDKFRCEGHYARTYDRVGVLVLGDVHFPILPLGCEICLHTGCEFCRWAVVSTFG